VLKHDKSIVWVFDMKGNLVWTEAYLVTSCDFKLYCKKVAVSIVTQ